MFSRLKTIINHNHISRRRQIFLLAIVLLLWAFMVYTTYFASEGALRFIGARQLDKIPHLLGGVFVAGLYERLLGRRKLVFFIFGLAAVTVLWEVAEFIFIPAIRFFYTLSPELWRLDSLGDITSGFLGGYSYWVFAMGRRSRG